MLIAHQFLTFLETVSGMYGPARIHVRVVYLILTVQQNERYVKTEGTNDVEYTRTSSDDNFVCTP
jgi:hypothetical protein